MSVDPDNAGPPVHALRDPLRIFYVDDDPILREFAVMNLTTDQAVLETAADGAEALAKIEGARPDIVLLDLEMPRLDGFETLRRLRADPRHRELPVIVVTSREDIDAIERAFGAGATSFAVKPMNWRLLSHQIRYTHRSALNERRLAEGRADAASRLTRLAAEGAQFISQALARDPDLRAAALGFARAADAALNLDAASKAA